MKSHLNGNIKLSKSSLGEEEKNAVMQVLDAEYLGMGQYVKDFEDQLQDFFSRPVVCVSSGTAALHLALQSIGVQNGDEVLVQSLTYVSSFQAISATGAKPVSCDIQLDTLCIDLADAESKITKNTKAIMPVHYSGGVGDLEKVYLLAKKYNLRVIEDAAHAFGGKYSKSKIGSFGDIVCFSFDGIKNITSGEGGCIVTSDEIVLKRARDARLLGVERDTEKRFTSNRSWKFNVKFQGWRYHMSNIMAAIGIEQLKKISEFSFKRQLLAMKYDELLSNTPLIKILNQNYNEVVPHIYPIQLNRALDRDCVMLELKKKGIETGIHYYPNHKLSIYHDSNINLINTENIYSQLLTLPLHTDLNVEDIKYICNNLLDNVRNE